MTIRMTAAERAVLKDGTVVDLYWAHLLHHINGKILTGNVIDDEGFVTKTQRAVPYGEIETHVALGYEDDGTTLVVDPTRYPHSFGAK